MKIKLYMSNGESITITGQDVPMVLDNIGKNTVIKSTTGSLFINMRQVAYAEVIEYDY